MSDLAQFTFDGSQVRTVLIDGEPWFVLADLAKVLGIASVPRLASRLDDDMRQTHTIADRMGRPQQMTIVSEAGMYDVIVRSDSPLATPFRRWITTEVLPQIRKTGAYGQPLALTDDQIVHQALQITAQRVQALEAENRILAPKASRYDTFLGADGDWSLRDAAQILSRDHGIKIGQNNLAKWMRGNEWIDRRGIPYQHRIDAGHLRAKPRTYKHPRTGEDVAADPQVRITPRGLDLLAKRLAGPTLVEVGA